MVLSTSPLLGTCWPIDSVYDRIKCIIIAWGPGCVIGTLQKGCTENLGISPEEIITGLFLGIAENMVLIVQFLHSSELLTSEHKGISSKSLGHTPCSLLTQAHICTQQSTPFILAALQLLDFLVCMRVAICQARRWIPVLRWYTCNGAYLGVDFCICQLYVQDLERKVTY